MTAPIHGASRGNGRALRVGLVQMRCVPDDPAANLARAIAGIEDAAARGATLICTQELFRTPYFCQAEEQTRFDLAEAIPGPTTEALAKVAAARGVTIVGSLFERRTEGLYHNTSVVLDADGSLAGVYRKMHIPDDPLYYEKYYFTPGDTGFKLLRHESLSRRHAGLLGPVVPRSRTPHRDGRRTGARLPDRDRLGDQRAPRMGGCRARRLGDRATRPRDRERRLRRRGEPRRLRGAPHLLGPVLRRRPVRTRDRARQLDAKKRRSSWTSTSR